MGGLDDLRLVAFSDASYRKAEIWPSYAQLYYLKSGHGIF